MSAAEEENDESFIEGSKNAYARNMRKKLLPSTLLNIVKGNIVYTPEGCWGEALTKYVSHRDFISVAKNSQPKMLEKSYFVSAQ